MALPPASEYGGSGYRTVSYTHLDVYKRQIILYLQLTSPGFLEVLYGNPFGVCAMTVCLGIYGLSYWLGKRIVDIEV